jgi:two-component system nitrogen regulation response regulator GlnG/two-component system response regulator HydG
VFALVVVWSADEPQRVGESVLVPANADPQRKFLFGRGAAQDGEDGERLNLFWARPASLQPDTAVNNPWISRRQLLIRVDATRGLRIENTGRCKMLVNGAPTETALLRPGDTLELKNHLLLFCIHQELPSQPASAYPLDRVPRFGEPDPDGIVGESQSIWRLRDQIAFLAARSGNVLLLGASGTGKELVANAIHNLSARRGKQLLARNAATFPEGLIDAELFGNLKDYPNAGMPARPGLIGAADSGTLFLDEIGELPPKLQGHLLRVLDSGGEYQRLGEAFTRHADVRLIAATNRTIDQLKHDLAARFPFRLNVPDLNGRREDVPLLVRHVLRRAAAKDAALVKRFFNGWDSDHPEPRVAPELVDVLVRHEYSTHVRELEAILWEAAATSPGNHLALADTLRQKLTPSGGAARAMPADEPTREEVQACLERNEGVQERAWRELGLKNRYVLKRLIKKFGL